MRVLSEITINKDIWLVYAKTDTVVTLLSSKAVYTGTVGVNAKNKIAEYADTQLATELKYRFAGKLIKTLGEGAMPSIPVPFSKTMNDKLKDGLFRLPPIKEKRCWLIETQDTPNNYMYIADNDGMVIRSCVYDTTGGVRAVIEVLRSALSDEQNAIIDLADVVESKCKTTGVVGQAKYILSKGFRVVGRLASKIEYNILLVPAAGLMDKPSNIEEIRDVAKDSRNICSIPDVYVDYYTINPEYTIMHIISSPSVTPDIIAEDIKMRLVPESVREKPQRKLFGKPAVQHYWREGYLVSTDEIRMTTVKAYIGTLSDEDIAKEGSEDV